MLYRKTASNRSNFTSINNVDFFLLLATIVLAGINDVDGIILGGVLGHTICTGLAVIAGALISRKISVRAVTFIGAIGKMGCPKNIRHEYLLLWLSRHLESKNDRPWLAKI